MSDFCIRAAAPADVPQILALLKELAVYEKVPEGKFTLTEAAILRDMFGTACHCDLAFQDETAVGIATWFWTYRSFRAMRGLYVEDLYVKPACRGQGLGRQFLFRLARQAREAGAYMEWRVLDWNAPAITFYEGLGARLVPEWVDCRLEAEALERLPLFGEKA